MMREQKRACVVLAAVAVLATVSCDARADAPGPGTARDLDRLHASLSLDSLSDDIWPGWSISATPAAYVDSAGCWLLGDAESFGRYERVRTDAPYDVRLAPPDGDGVSERDATVGGEPVALLTQGALSPCVVPAVFEAAFKCHVQQTCSELGSPDDAIVGAPSQPRDVALSDIEREIVLAALTTSPDSLESLVRDFVCVRSYRRAQMTPGFVTRERSREYRDGMAAYVRFRARDLAERHVDPGDEALLTPSVKDTFCLRNWLCKPAELDWYRDDRFACMGAAVCYLLERTGTPWRDQVVERCIDPYAILWTKYMGGRADAAPLLERYGYERREVEAAAFIDATKSEPERLFDDIAQCEGPLFIINTGQLASTTVSFDRNNIAHVDDHREVHKRILKIEFSGGTHVYVIGRQTAAVIGKDEFDFQQLMLHAPDDYEIEVDGVPFTPVPGINHLNGSLSVTAQGVEIEARDAIIVSAEERTSFLLHR